MLFCKFIIVHLQHHYNVNIAINNAWLPYFESAGELHYGAGCLECVVSAGMNECRVPFPQHLTHSDEAATFHMMLWYSH